MNLHSAGQLPLKPPPHAQALTHRLPMHPKSAGWSQSPAQSPDPAPLHGPGVGSEGWGRNEMKRHNSHTPCPTLALTGTCGRPEPTGSAVQLLLSRQAGSCDLEASGSKMGVPRPRRQTSEDPLGRIRRHSPPRALPPSNYVPSNYPKPALTPVWPPSLCLPLPPQPHTQPRLSPQRACPVRQPPASCLPLSTPFPTRTPASKS